MNEDRSVDGALFRQVMRGFATGVTVMTVRVGDETHAMTANAVTSVSLAPPLVLVCVKKLSRSHDLVTAAGAFALNILGEDQRELGERFAYDPIARADPSAVLPCTRAVTGSPIFQVSLGYLDCRVAAAYDGIDHTIFLGRVVAAELKRSAAGPLLYFQGRFTQLPPDPGEASSVEAELPAGRDSDRPI